MSSRVFQDSKKLGAIRAGADITLGRFNTALEWFWANWPEGAVWPHDVEMSNDLTVGIFDALTEPKQREAAE